MKYVVLLVVILSGLPAVAADDIRGLEWLVGTWQRDSLVVVFQADVNNPKFLVLGKVQRKFNDEYIFDLNLSITEDSESKIALTVQGTIMDRQDKNRYFNNGMNGGRSDWYAFKDGEPPVHLGWGLIAKAEDESLSAKINPVNILRLVQPQDTATMIWLDLVTIRPHPGMPQEMLISIKWNQSNGISDGYENMLRKM